jgi:hypothetical protein
MRGVVRGVARWVANKVRNIDADYGEVMEVEAPGPNT